MFEQRLENPLCFAYINHLVINILIEAFCTWYLIFSISNLWEICTKLWDYNHKLLSVINRRPLSPPTVVILKYRFPCRCKFRRSLSPPTEIVRTGDNPMEIIIKEWSRQLAEPLQKSFCLISLSLFTFLHLWITVCY